MSLALIDFFISNKLLNKKGLSAIEFFKFARMVNRSKIRPDINTCTFYDFNKVISSKIWAISVDLKITENCFILLFS